VAVSVKIRKRWTEVSSSEHSAQQFHRVGKKILIKDLPGSPEEGKVRSNEASQSGPTCQKKTPEEKILEKKNHNKKKKKKKSGGGGY